jgi:hypothetical protein
MAMDDAERELLAETVRDALTDAPNDSADDVLFDLGWLEMLATEPRDAIDIVFTTLGTTNASASVLDDVLVTALGFEPRPDLAVLLPPFATATPPARTDGEARGLATRRAATAKELVVVGPGVAATIPMESVTVTAVHGVDPDFGLHTVTVAPTPALATAIDAGAWTAAVAAGRRAVSHQIAGACRTMLDLARAHALERTQFGRPVARFQAVRHRLAETLVAIEACDAALGAAWDAPNHLTAALAKATACRSTRTVAQHCQQVLAGIGFTTDHAFHWYLKRTMVLDGIFGSADGLAIEIGRELLATRSVPTLIEL